MCEPLFNVLIPCSVEFFHSHLIVSFNDENTSIYIKKQTLNYLILPEKIG